MLIKQNKSDKSNSKYRCDMCKIQISPLKRVVINKAQGYENPKKKWDLCEKCYRKVERAIDNWHIKIKEGKK